MAVAVALPARGAAGSARPDDARGGLRGSWPSSPRPARQPWRAPRDGGARRHGTSPWLRGWGYRGARRARGCSANPAEREWSKDAQDNVRAPSAVPRPDHRICASGPITGTLSPGVPSSRATLEPVSKALRVRPIPDMITCRERYVARWAVGVRPTASAPSAEARPASHGPACGANHRAVRPGLGLLLGDDRRPVRHQRAFRGLTPAVSYCDEVNL